MQKLLIFSILLFKSIIYQSDGCGLIGSLCCFLGYMVFVGGLLCLVFSHSKDSNQSVSLGDLVMKWKIHKANSGCGYSGIQALIKKKKLLLV